MRPFLTVICCGIALVFSPFAFGDVPIQVITDAPASQAKINDQSDIAYIGKDAANNRSIFRNGFPVFDVGSSWYLSDDHNDRATAASIKTYRMDNTGNILVSGTMGPLPNAGAHHDAYWLVDDTLFLPSGEVIAYSGQAAHGRNDGSSYDYFGFFETPPAISNTGLHIAYQAGLKDLAGPDRFGLWTGNGVEGYQESLASTSVTCIACLSSPSVNSSGQLAYMRYDNFFEGLYLFDGQQEIAIVTVGDEAPGTKGQFGEVQWASNAASGGPVSLNDTGDVAFHGLFGPVDSGSGIWIGNENGLELVARTGDQAPSLPGLTIDYFGYRLGKNVELNEIGDVLVQARISGNNVDPNNDFAVFVGDADDLRFVVREGDPAPGASDDFTFDSGLDVQFNDLSTVLVSTRSIDENGIWYMLDEGVLEPLLVPGQTTTIQTLNGLEPVTVVSARAAPEDGINNHNEVLAYITYDDALGQRFTVLSVVTIPEPRNVFFIVGFGFVLLSRLLGRPSV